MEAKICVAAAPRPQQYAKFPIADTPAAPPNHGHADCHLLCVIHELFRYTDISDIAQNAGISTGKYASLCTNQMPCYLLTVRNDI